jgi:hypothetical protein
MKNLNESLFELGKYLIDFIVWIAAAAIGIYGFATVGTCSTIFVKVWVLRSTGAFEFAIF